MLNGQTKLPFGQELSHRKIKTSQLRKMWIPMCSSFCISTAPVKHLRPCSFRPSLWPSFFVDSTRDSSSNQPSLFTSLQRQRAIVRSDTWNKVYDYLSSSTLLTVHAFAMHCVFELLLSNLARFGNLQQFNILGLTLLRIV